MFAKDIKTNEHFYRAIDAGSGVDAIDLLESARRFGCIVQITAGRVDGYTVTVEPYQSMLDIRKATARDGNLRVAIRKAFQNALPQEEVDDDPRPGNRYSSKNRANHRR